MILGYMIIVYAKITDYSENHCLFRNKDKNIYEQKRLIKKKRATKKDPIVVIARSEA